MNYIKEHLQLLLRQITDEKESCIAEQDFNNAAGFRDADDLLRKVLVKLPPPIIWTDEQCTTLNAHQSARLMHPYTCGNDSNHKPLVATRRGWVCVDCDYRQNWSHQTGEKR